MIYFVSDTHCWHNNIIKYCNRPFLCDADREVWENVGRQWHTGQWKGVDAVDHRISNDSVKLMNDTIIDNINKYVRPEDTLWHLGDVLFGRKYDYIQRVEEFTSRINCKNIHLVWGNHDNRHPYGFGKSIEEYFKSNHDLVEISVEGQRIALCHYALATFNKSHRGTWHLYGHSHTTAENWMDRHMPGRRSMDVGVDNAYRLLGEFRPFSFDEIKSIFAGRKGFSMDHHIDPNTPTEEELIG